MVKSRVLSVVLIIPLLFSLVACGNGKENVPTKATESSGEVSEQNNVQENIVTTEEGSSTPEVQGGTEQFLNLTRTSTSYRFGEMVGDEYATVEVMQQYFQLEEESAKCYPDLAKTLETIGNQCVNTAKTAMNDLMENYAELVKYGNYLSGLEDKGYCSVLRADENVFSYLYQNENYYGGSHGGYLITGMAFDVKTGKQLMLTDIVKDGNAMKEIVAKQLDETYGDIFFKDVYTLIDEYSMDTFSWSLDYNGITLYFNQYELASYADGVQMITLPREQYPDLLNEKYFVPQEQYIMELSDYYEYKMDLNNDGKQEVFSVYREYHEEDYYTTTVKLNDESFASSIWDFSEDSFLVKQKDTAYLYLFHRAENDYSTLEVFDLVTGQFVEGLGEQKNLFFAAKYDDSIDEQGIYRSNQTQSLFTNPERFRLSTRLDTLGTYSGFKTYRVGENGLPVTTDTVYCAEPFYLIKTKAEVPCKLLNKDGTVLEENGTLPAGLFLKICYATPQEAYVVKAVDYSIKPEEAEWGCYTEDENTVFDEEVLYLIQLDMEYGYEISGISIWDLFEGLMYAG